MSMTIVLGLIIFVIIIFIVIIYNNLVVARNAYKNAYSQIDVQLKRRYDLIPNLVDSVKGIMKFEQETLAQVISARSGAMSAAKAAAENPGGESEMKRLAMANAGLTGAMGKIFALAEAYPDLKASNNMKSLQEELASTENRVAFARQAFNDAVMNFNNTIQVFPNSIIAGTFNFQQATLLDAIESPEERRPVKVSF